MGLRGPKPKPNALKLLAGNPGRRPIQAAAGPRYAPGAPAMPKNLSKPARAVWKRTCRVMAAAGALAEADRDTLAAYCVAVAGLEECNALIDLEGFLIDVPTVDRNGRLTGATVRKLHPAIKVRSDLMGKVLLFARDLGLTPAARSRAGAVAEAEPAAPNKVGVIRDRIAAIRRGENVGPSGNKVIDIAARFQAAE